MTQWISKNTLSLAAIIGVAAWLVFVGNIAWQTIFPLEVAIFKDVRIPTDKVYRPGDVVRYEVEMEKLHPYAADVTRIIRCKPALFYLMMPDQRGTAGVGSRVGRPNFMLPDEVTGPDECYLDTTFTYNNINQYHDPIRYKKNSNWFKVMP